MPNGSRSHREKQRKKTRYSSDSDSDREVSRKYREKSSSKSRTKSLKHKSSSSRRKRYSSSSSSSSSSSRRRSSSSSSRKSSPAVSSREQSRSSSKKNFDHITKFEINDLYKEEDKVKVLNDLEADSFKQETFQSKKKIVVDLQKDKILIPEQLAAQPEEESLIHPNFLGDEEAKVDKWIKKLTLYRNS